MFLVLRLLHVIFFNIMVFLKLAWFLFKVHIDIFAFEKPFVMNLNQLIPYIVFLNITVSR